MHLFPGQLAGTCSAHGRNTQNISPKKEKASQTRQTTAMNIAQIYKIFSSSGKLNQAKNFRYLLIVFELNSL
jgi:hypothetical protein